ncbi:hypothetical protein AKG98_2780 [Moritella sp. JT01]|uniref:hypothetical protein n=1 Tax=Moritella sp. JT01 TaxID=756698 RepID=UPI000799D4E6|nr:hypothetical protein [Moritella sp. JT01]KXO07005.1 hypothetical protein AKG98_2780 [Moritella sp. JT01]
MFNINIYDNNTALKESINTLLLTAESLQDIAEYISIKIKEDGIHIHAMGDAKSIFTSAFISSGVFSEMVVHDECVLNVKPKVLFNALKKIDIENADTLNLTMDYNDQSIKVLAQNRTLAQRISINYMTNQVDERSEPRSYFDAQAIINTNHLLKINQIAETQDETLAIAICENSISFSIENDDVTYHMDVINNDESQLSLYVENPMRRVIILKDFNCLLKAALLSEQVTISLQEEAATCFEINLGDYTSIKYYLFTV